MATKKSKKTKSSKSADKKAETKSTKVEKAEVEAKVVDKKKSSPKKATAKDSDGKKVIASGTTAEGYLSSSPLKGFFARKGDPDENILTIFKAPRLHTLIGGVIGEVIGTMLITMFLLTMGIYQPLYAFFAYVAVTAAVVGLSGAHLNPLVTVGMMASRRVSAIRGVFYILAQVLGAWFGLLIVNAFRLAGSGETELPKMTEVDTSQFAVIALVELLGAFMIAFFYARARVYKRSALTFATMVGAGYLVALLIVIMFSTSYLGMQNNFMMNPAVALMYQILPTSAESFGALMGNMAVVLSIYVVFPMIGGVLGFYLSDLSQRLSGDPARK